MTIPAPRLIGFEFPGTSVLRDDGRRLVMSHGAIRWQGNPIEVKRKGSKSIDENHCIPPDLLNRTPTTVYFRALVKLVFRRLTGRCELCSDADSSCDLCQSADRIAPGSVLLSELAVLDDGYRARWASASPVERESVCKAFQTSLQRSAPLSLVEYDEDAMPLIGAAKRGDATALRIGHRVVEISKRVRLEKKGDATEHVVLYEDGRPVGNLKQVPKGEELQDLKSSRFRFLCAPIADGDLELDKERAVRWLREWRGVPADNPGPLTPVVRVEVRNAETGLKWQDDAPPHLPLCHLRERAIEEGYAGPNMKRLVGFNMAYMFELEGFGIWLDETHTVGRAMELTRGAVPLRLRLVGLAAPPIRGGAPGSSRIVVDPDDEWDEEASHG